MFAKGTGVAAEKSRAEIEKLLRARKATQLGVSFDDENGEAIVIFTMPGKLITAAEPAKSWTNPPTPATAEVREPKQTVSFEIEDFETAFLPHLLVPSGGTVRDHVMPAYRNSLSNPGAPLLGSGR